MGNRSIPPDAVPIKLYGKVIGHVYRTKYGTWSARTVRSRTGLKEKTFNGYFTMGHAIDVLTSYVETGE